MKHLFNNLSSEEKNNILEQHTGGKKILIENFNNLMSHKLGEVKPLVNEQSSSSTETPLELVNMDKCLELLRKLMKIKNTGNPTSFSKEEKDSFIKTLENCKSYFKDQELKDLTTVTAWLKS